jgi:hypothetical protein
VFVRAHLQNTVIKAGTPVHAARLGSCANLRQNKLEFGESARHVTHAAAALLPSLYPPIARWASSNQEHPSARPAILHVYSFATTMPDKQSARALLLCRRQTRLQQHVHVSLDLTLIKMAKPAGQRAGARANNVA